MVKLFTYIAILAGTLMVASAPWLSALMYSTVSVMQPQYIWFWVFEDFSIFRISAGIAIVAWMIQAFKGNINWQAYSLGQFKGVLALMIIFHLSNWLTPFDTYKSAVSGQLVVDIFFTIFIMYFIVLGLINKVEVVKFFAIMFILITVYYTYWANDHYLAGNWGQFTLGRLRGPDLSPYADGNVLSIILTIGLSFVMFGVQYFKRKWIKIILIMVIPLLWHALILFASRGALLSAASVTIFFAYIVKSKLLNILVVVGFLAMIIWQGGQLLSRTTGTLNLAQNNSVDAPLNPRLVSWQIGWGLALKYPLLGAGPQRFQHASRVHYPDKARHVAHNTFLNFSANTGLISGFIYLMFFYTSYKQYRYVSEYGDKDSDTYYVNVACMGGLIAFFVGAVFLDLIIFEPFYFVLLLISANYFIVKKQIATKVSETEKEEESALVDDPKRGVLGRV